MIIWAISCWPTRMESARRAISLRVAGRSYHRTNIQRWNFIDQRQLYLGSGRRCRRGPASLLRHQTNSRNIMVRLLPPFLFLSCRETRARIHVTIDRVGELGGFVAWLCLPGPSNAVLGRGVACDVIKGLKCATSSPGAQREDRC